MLCGTDTNYAYGYRILGAGTLAVGGNESTIATEVLKEIKC
jgi:hypothetical protein